MKVPQDIKDYLISKNLLNDFVDYLYEKSHSKVYSSKQDTQSNWRCYEPLIKTDSCGNQIRITDDYGCSGSGMGKPSSSC